MRSTAVAIFALAQLVTSLQTAMATDGSVSIEVSSPAEQARIAGPTPLIEVSGWASSGRLVGQDFVLVVDVSGSTLLASGVDVDGNGIVGRVVSRQADPKFNPQWLCSDPGDTIRAAEFVATLRVLAAVDPSRTRVGLVIFESAVLKSLPVSASRAQVEATIDRFQHHMGVVAISGGTNFAAALRGALQALEVNSSGSQDARKGRHVIFLSDGLPNEPTPAQRAAKEAIVAAKQIADAGGDIQAFALGHEPEQEGDGLAVYSKMAEITGGTLTRLPTPGDVVARLPQIDLVGLAAIDIANETTGQPARAAWLAPDGSFDGFVSLAPGENRIHVSVRDKEGIEAARDRVVWYDAREPMDAEEARRFDDEQKAMLERLRTRTTEVELVNEIQSARDKAATKRELDLHVGPTQETPSNHP